MLLKKYKKQIYVGIFLIILFSIFGGIYFLEVYPSPLENLGMINFNENNWDGYDLTMKLSKTSEFWGVGWNTYDWNIIEIRPGLSIQECYEKGLTYAYPQGYCYTDFDKAYVKSKKATLTINNIQTDLSNDILISRQNIGVTNILNPGVGNLDVEVVFNFYCRLNEQKCINKELFICESTMVHIGNNFFDYMGIPQYDKMVNRWISKGESQSCLGQTCNGVMCDGVCKDSCEESDYTGIIILGVFIVLIGGLTYWYIKSKRRSR